jgi:ribosome-binding protein aMBF1 (putative translation factor)
VNMKTNEKALNQMRRAHVAQTETIRAKPEFKKVSAEFDIEYEVALQMQQAREKAGLTQAEIARRMKTTQSVVSRIESGANASLDTLLRYARACDRRLQVKFV